jgi:hypothetical protein
MKPRLLAVETAPKSASHNPVWPAWGGEERPYADLVAPAGALSREFIRLGWAFGVLLGALRAYGQKVRLRGLRRLSGLAQK